jgi:hypothetical protein
MSRDCSDSIVASCGLDGQGSILGRCKRFFCCTQYPDWLWVPPKSYGMAMGGSFPGGKTAEA